MKVKAIVTKTYEVDAPCEDKDDAIEYASLRILSEDIDSKTFTISYVDNFNQIPNDVAENILNNVINYVAEEEQGEYETIKKLFRMGFSGEVLVNYFGFNMISVGEVEEIIMED